MKYSYEFKKECVRLYRLGEWADTPKGIGDKQFRDMIMIWHRLEDLHGPEVLKHSSGRVRTADEKFELISKVMVGESVSSVAIKAGISRGQLYMWVTKYKEFGYNGIENKKRGRKSKNITMKKNTNNTPKNLTESEREELIRLRTENEYIKAENEVIKKEIALREKNYAAQLKAKKQRSSKNLEKKGIN